MTTSTSRLRQVETDRGQKVKRLQQHGQRERILGHLHKDRSFSEGCSLCVSVSNILSFVVPQNETFHAFLVAFQCWPFI